MATPQELAAKAQAAIKQQRENDAKKVAAALEVERANQQVNGRTFYARIPHSKFIFSDNVEAIFAFGRLEVSPKTFTGKYHRPTGPGMIESKDNGRPRWEVYKEELEAIVPPNGTNPNIFTQDTVDGLEELKLPEINAVDETSILTTDAVIARGGNTKVQQQIGEVTIGGMPSNVNTSTLDGELLKASQKSGATPLGNTDVITRLDPAKLENGNSSQSVS